MDNKQNQIVKQWSMKVLIIYRIEVWKWDYEKVAPLSNSSSGDDTNKANILFPGLTRLTRL